MRSCALAPVDGGDPMNNQRSLGAALAAALLLFAGGASAGSRTIVDDTPETTGPPIVEIVVYDGTQLPAKVVAGCSEPDNCLGWTGPISGTVTHSKNNVGWGVGDGDPRGRIYLYVDGQYVTSARPGRLIVWSVGNLAPGAHTVEAMAMNYAGVEGWSTPLVIQVVK